MANKRSLLKRMVDDYQLWLENNGVIREVIKLQGEGRFSPTRVEIGHYLWFAELATKPSVLETLPDVVRVLDVGAYLNLFANFLNNIEVVEGRRFDCAGIEIRPEHCELSNRIFRENRLVCGDAAEMDRLFDVKFDIIIFCGYFHREDPKPEETILQTLRAADKILNSGGILAIMSPDERKIHSRNFFLPSADAGPFPPGRFMPDGYSYSDKSNAECWFIARKNRAG
ncbi:MAG: class I SAM-dependent methyltransferase [bacterium]